MGLPIVLILRHRGIALLGSEGALLNTVQVQHLMCFHSQRLDALDARWAADERLPGAAPDNGLQ